MINSLEMTANLLHISFYLLQTYDVEGAVKELLYGERVKWARLDGPYAVVFMVGSQVRILALLLICTTLGPYT